MTVVGRLPPTGSPWDKAVLVPIEFVWQVHGLGTGHGPAPEHAGESAGDNRDGAEGDEHEHAAVEADVPIGPPFDLEALPGIPAAVVKPRTLAEAYGLRNTWRTTETTAFFPAEVLVQLYELIGDVRVVMSALAVATQTLLVAAILAGILILMRLYTQRFAVLRALGAPRLYIFAVVWTFSFALIAGGAALGLLVAAALAGSVSSIFEHASGIAMTAAIGAPEFALAAGIAVVGALIGERSSAAPLSTARRGRPARRVKRAARRELTQPFIHRVTNRDLTLAHTVLNSIVQGVSTGGLKK